MAVDLTEHVVAGAFRDAQVGPAARALAAEVDFEQAARAVTDEIMREVWPNLDDPSFHDAVLRSTIGNLACIFSIIAGTEGVTDAEPEGAMEFAELTARLGIPIAEIDKAYRVGTASLWSMWFDAARQHTDEAPIDELISGPTMVIHTYVDRILDEVAIRHQQVRDATRSTLAELRRRTLVGLIDGTGPTDTDEAERILGYRVADTHLAVVLESTDSAAPERDLAELRTIADARGALLLQHAPRTWIAFVGRPTGFSEQCSGRLRRALAQLPCAVSVSEPRSGLEGLRRARAEALEAARVHRALDQTTCLWARDVRLETLLLADEERAREFIADELGDLGAPDAAVGRLRETLLAWLASGSHVSAAAVLGVHENTVRNRIRAAEELLGTPLMGRRIELQVALRLQRVLAATA
jgi:DNA-binding PucR family transcriptional regulator